jgi:hypothetical protein
MVIFHSYVSLPVGTEKEVSRLAIEIGTPNFDCMVGGVWKISLGMMTFSQRSETNK